MNGLVQRDDFFKPLWYLCASLPVGLDSTLKIVLT